MPHVSAGGSGSSGNGGSGAGSSAADRIRSEDPNDCDEVKVFKCAEDEGEGESDDVINDDKRDLIRLTECDQQDYCRWPDEPFEEMDSTLAVQQYIQQLIKNDPSNIDLILTNPETHDEGVWKYEHLRQFCMELNGLAVRLQSQCFPATCTQMTATEQWIFLCAAHKTPKECPAIDYTRHTLDGAACLLNSYKYFPSRVVIKESSVAKLGSVCRRVYRIFSHAYFHHRAIFDEFETKTFLCLRFTRFVLKYALMCTENLIVPIPKSGEESIIATSGESEA